VQVSFLPLCNVHTIVSGSYDFTGANSRVCGASTSGVDDIDMCGVILGRGLNELDCVTCIMSPGRSDSSSDFLVNILAPVPGALRIGGSATGR
jgi:hypothetical protein